MGKERPLFSEAPTGRQVRRSGEASRDRDGGDVGSDQCALDEISSLPHVATQKSGGKRSRFFGETETW